MANSTMDSYRAEMSQRQAARDRGDRLGVEAMSWTQSKLDVVLVVHGEAGRQKAVELGLWQDVAVRPSW
jgi:hypothetical protein